MLIRSCSNEKVKEIRKLMTRKERQRTGLYFITGMRLVIEALEVGVEVERLVIAPELAEKTAEPLYTRLMQLSYGIDCLQVTGEVFDTLTDRDDHCNGVGAVVRQSWQRLEDVALHGTLCWVAVNAVQFPSNLGTMLRSCDAVGAAGMMLVGNTVDPYDSACIRASLGAIFNQRLVRTTTDELSGWKAHHRCCFVGTSPAGQADYHEMVYPLPCLLLMGCERSGLPPDQLALCDAVVRIPMIGRCDSHNLAVATALVLYEMLNQARSTCKA